MKNYSPKKSNSSQQFWLLKTFVFYIFCCLLSTFYLYAQTPITQWQKAIGGTGDEYLWDIQKTSDGGSIEVGASSSSDGDISLNQGAYDVLVVKLNSAGTVEWEKTFGGSGDDFGYSIQQTSDGGYIVGAYTNSIDGNITAPKGGDDYWVIKLDATGNLQWQKSLGGTGEDFIGNVRQTTDGGYIVSGNSSSSDGDVSSNHGGDDVWMVKLNATGTTIEWQKTYGGSGNDECYNGEPTTDGGYIVAAYSDSNDGDISFNHGSNDIWVIKLDTAGNLQWQKTLGGSGDDNIPYIHQTSDGGFIFTCTTISTDGDITGTHYGATDIWVVKLNSTGIIQWQKTFGGSAVDNASSIQQTSDGGYLISSFTLSTDIPNITNHGNIDILLIKINNSGVMQWQNYYGGSSWDQPANAYQANDGSYVFAGASASSDGDITGNHGGSDAWTVKILKYTAIPDTNFEQALFDLGIDTVNGDHRVLTDAISGISSLNVTQKNIADLTGIQDFAALTNLNCSENSLTSLNINGLVHLQNLLCGSNLLSSINVSNLTQLITISVYNNKLTNLNLSGLTNLTDVNGAVNSLLTNVNVSGLSNLKTLILTSDNLSTINLSGLTHLDNLDVGSNHLSTLDLSACPNLTILGCYSNNLPTINVTSLTLLNTLNCSFNPISNLVLNSTNLSWLTSTNCALTSLDLSAVPNLLTLDCRNNLLSSLNVSNLTLLKSIHCENNHLTNLNLCSTTHLEGFSCSNNLLTVLDLQNTSLQNGNYNFMFSDGNNISFIYVNDIAAASTNTDWVKDATSVYSSGYGVGGTVSSNQTICYNTQPNDLVLSGNVGAVLKWQKALDSNFTNPTDIAVTSASLSGTTIGNVTNTIYCRAVVQNSPCTSVYSNYAIISAYNATVAGTATSNQTIDINTTPDDLMLTGNTGTILKWQKSTDPYFSTFTDISVTASTLSGVTIGSLPETTYFRVVLQEGGGCTEYYSNTIKILVLGPFTMIPDPNFEQALINLGIDTNPVIDHRVLTSAISVVTTLALGDYYGIYYGLTDLTGIQDFTALTYLDCSGGFLTSLDVSHNLNLTTLYCFDNSITSLDLSANINLTELYIDRNPINTLDVSHNTALINFSCSGAQLTTLDVSANTNLSSLDTSLNPISSLNVTANTNLIYLDCGADLLTNLNITNLVNLTDLYCGTNSLSSLDVSHNFHLINFDCQLNQLTNLDVTHNPDLAYFVCSSNQLTNLDVSSNNLTDLYCDNNLLTGLNINNLTNLTSLNFESNQLTSIDFSHNLNLNFISGDSNSLTSLDVSMLPLLQKMFVRQNQQLTTLKLCANPNLEWLFVQNSLLTSLDLRNCSALSYLIANQNNNLDTIYVNNLTAANNHEAAGEWNKDATATFSTATAVGGTVSSNQIICSNSQLNNLVLTNNVGYVLKWQKSTNIDFSNNVIDIQNRSSTLTPLEIGTIISPTYFRAIVESGNCLSSSNSNIVTISKAIISVWNGNDWSNGIPDQTKDITILNDFIAYTNLTGCALNVTNNANVIINPGVNVFLNGAINVDSGSSFTLSNSSNLIQTTNVQNSGVINVQRTTSPLYRLDYDTWSSPVSGTQTLTNFSPLTTSNRFYTYDTTTNLYNSIADPSTTTFTKGKGYLIRTPNNWVSYSATATPAPWTGMFNGVPNNGPISIPLVDGGSTDTRYNAVGNPYPSTIKISDFFNANSSAIDGTLWFWRKTNDASNQVSYSTCSNAGCTLNNGFNFYTNFNFISPGQGFIVHSKANQNNLNFTNAIRYADNTNQFFKTNQNNIDRFWLELKNSANASFGQFLMAYLPGATVNYDDGLDGLYINDSQTILSAIVDNKELVIEARPSFDVQDVAPLQFRTNNADTYTISLHSTEGVFSTNQDIFIRDNQTGSVQNLKEDNYTFVSNNGVYPGRFDLLYQNTLLSVNSQTINDDAITIYKSNETIYIDSANFLMSNVKIFDIRGRLLIEKLKINDTKLSIDTAIYGNQMLLVQITLDGGNIIYKKVMN